MQTFEKSLLSLEAIYSLVQKNQTLFSSAPSADETPPSVSSLLNKMAEVQKLCNISFKSITNTNYIINQSLK